MEPVNLRPVVGPSQLPPTRQPEAPAAVRTDLAIEATVQPGTKANEARDRDPRQESDLRRPGTTDLASVRRREIENDAATGLTVMKVIEERSGEVVDQLPADAYLRMKIALRSVLEEGGGDNRVAQRRP